MPWVRHNVKRTVWWKHVLWNRMCFIANKSLPSLIALLYLLFVLSALWIRRYNNCLCYVLSTFLSDICGDIASESLSSIIAMFNLLSTFCPCQVGVRVFDEEEVESGLSFLKVNELSPQMAELVDGEIKRLLQVRERHSERFTQRRTQCWTC